MSFNNNTNHHLLKISWPLWNIRVTYDHWYVPLVINTSLSFPHLWITTGFVTRLARQVPLVEQELHTSTLQHHLSSSPVFSGIHVTQSLVLYVCLLDRCLSFCTFFAIVLSVLLRFTDSNYPFCIIKLFLILFVIINIHLVEYILTCIIHTHL